MRRILLAALVALSALTVSMPSFSRRFLFPGSAATEMPSDFVAHGVRSADGAIALAYELPAPDAARTVVYFHNNREAATDCVALARDLHAHGYGVVVVEYRGYGASRDLVPTEAALYADAEAVLRMLAARGVGAARVTLWGTSLGSGIAAEMAARGLGSRLVLVSPYTSIPDLVSDAAPVVPARALLADHFDTLSKAPSIAASTLVVHGDADAIVPFWMGERIAHAIREARLLRIAGAGHADWRERAGTHLWSALAHLDE